jgi:hypothetical protein
LNSNIVAQDAVIDWENPFQEHLVKLNYHITDTEWYEFLREDKIIAIPDSPPKLLTFLSKE